MDISKTTPTVGPHLKERKASGNRFLVRTVQSIGSQDPKHDKKRYNYNVLRLNVRVSPPPVSASIFRWKDLSQSGLVTDGRARGSALLEESHAELLLIQILHFHSLISRWVLLSPTAGLEPMLSIFFFLRGDWLDCSQ